jgi:hypothetical protein
MNRRDFLKKLGWVAAGSLVLPHVPKVLYVDMGKNLIHEPFSIERITVNAKHRTLKADWTIELADDLYRVHGLKPAPGMTVIDDESIEILSKQILEEINREVVRTIYNMEVPSDSPYLKKVPVEFLV